MEEGKFLNSLLNVLIYLCSGLYIKYLHSLIKMHEMYDNHVECALAYKLHADLMPWSHKITVEPVSEYGFNNWQTCFERKEEVIIF